MLSFFFFLTQDNLANLLKLLWFKGGRKRGERVDILNAFEGEDARALYELLTEKAKACADGQNLV